MTEERIPQQHAIVFGAAGLLGWSVVNQLLSSYPHVGTFSRVTAVMNRAVTEADLCFPETVPDRPTLEIVSGIDLNSGSASDLATQLSKGMSEADTITHAFYFVFSAFSDDYIREREINCAMMERVATALNLLAPSLKSFVYSGGTRGYGIYIPGGTFQPPLHEELADQLPDDYAQTVAYPWFRQILTRKSQGYGWNWTEVCPDVVVGFSPNGSAFSLALHWAQYLALYALNHRESIGHAAGERPKVAFPGSVEGFDSKFTPVSGRMLGRIAIHAAVHPGICGGKVVNMMDTETPTTFRQLWPAIAGFFGLEGVGPDNDKERLKPGEYVAKYRHLFEKSGRPKAVNCGVGAGSQQLDAVGWWLTFDRELSGERLRSMQFKEQRNPIEGWLEAFGQFKNAGII